MEGARQVSHLYFLLHHRPRSEMQHDEIILVLFYFSGTSYARDYFWVSMI